jgi:hypothetical protein
MIKKPNLTDLWAPTSDLVSSVSKYGWLHLRAAESENSLSNEVLKIAHLLGEPLVGRNGNVVETLTPLEIQNANIRSLSKKHGAGTFPLHIDGAHHIQPPRFVILACVRPGSNPVPTILVRFRDLQLCETERQQCESATFLVQNGRRSFYSCILGRSRPFVRFDQGCMKPICDEGKEAVKAILSHAAEITSVAHTWQPRDILIIDNWNMLHGRGFPSSSASLDRLILRVSIQ